MPPITDANLYLSFSDVDISGIYRSFDPGFEEENVDTSAGGSTMRTMAPTLEKVNPTLTAIYNVGHSGITKLVVGATGTLTWAPEGTAAGKPKWSINARVAKANASFQYDGEVELDVDFVNTGTAWADDGRSATFS